MVGFDLVFCEFDVSGDVLLFEYEWWCYMSESVFILFFCCVVDLNLFESILKKKLLLNFSFCEFVVNLI